MLIFISILLSTAYSQTPLTNYPGFFPHHLGPAYVTSSKLSYVYYIDKKPLTRQLNKLISTAEIMHTRIVNSDDQFINITLLPRLSDINNQIINAKKLHDNLLLNKNFRQKRGLIDLGGSIIKTLFGTLDAEDGKAIYESLNELQKNQQILKLGLNKQIELYNDLTEEFNTTIKTLNSDIIAIEHQLNNLTKIFIKSRMSVYRHLELDNLLNRLEINVQKYYDELTKIETSLYFSKLNLLTHEIISTDQMFSLIRKCATDNKNMIVEFDDIHTYYKMINLQSFTYSEKILFVINIPLTNPYVYSFYHIIPVPINNQMIIPATPYLAISQEDQLGVTQECPHLENKYICSSLDQKMNIQDTCIVPIILHKNKKNCTKIHTNLKTDLIRQIDENLLIIVPKRKIVIEEHCPDLTTRTANEPILYVIPTNCKVNIHNRSYYTTKQPQQEELKPIPEIDMGSIQLHESIPIDDMPEVHINISHISRKIQEPIFLQVHRSNIITQSSVWTVVLITLAGFASYYIYKKRRVQHQQIQAEEEPLGIIEKSPPSIFQS